MATNELDPTINPAPEGQEQEAQGQEAQGQQAPPTPPTPADQYAQMLDIARTLPPEHQAAYIQAWIDSQRRQQAYAPPSGPLPQVAAQQQPQGTPQQEEPASAQMRRQLQEKEARMREIERLAAEQGGATPEQNLEYNRLTTEVATLGVLLPDVERREKEAAQREQQMQLQQMQQYVLNAAPSLATQYLPILEQEAPYYRAFVSDAEARAYLEAIAKAAAQQGHVQLLLDPAREAERRLALRVEVGTMIQLKQQGQLDQFLRSMGVSVAQPGSTPATPPAYAPPQPAYTPPAYAPPATPDYSRMGSGPTPPPAGQDNRPAPPEAQRLGIKLLKDWEAIPATGRRELDF